MGQGGDDLTDLTLTDSSGVQVFRGRQVGGVTSARFTVPFSALVAHAGGYRFAPVHTFVPGDWILAIGVVCTVAFDDTNSGSLNLQVTDEGNFVALSGTSLDGSASPTQTQTGASDPFSFAGAGFAGGNWTNVLDGLIGAAFVAGVCDNGSMAGDGTAGTLEVLVLYSPAP